MTERVWGQCHSSLNTAPVEGMQAIRAMGVDTVRLAVDLAPARRENDPMIRADGSFDFSRTDIDMAAMRAAGLKVNYNPHWLPRQWTGGYPINEPYASTTWVDPRDGNKGRRYLTKEEAPWLFPPYPDPMFATDSICGYGKVSGYRYGPEVAYLSVWNEADGLDFYPQKDAPPSYLEALRPLYEGVIIPFVRGWRSAWPGVLFVGPDSMSPGNLDLFLRLEAEHADDPTWPKYDILAYHVYPDGGPESETIFRSLARINNYQEVIRRFPAHRHTPQWATEYADGNAMDPVGWTAAILRAFPQISGLFPHYCGLWFEGGGAAWDAGRFEPNDNYRAMHALIHGTKRRAVRK